MFEPGTIAARRRAGVALALAASVALLSSVPARAQESVPAPGSDESPDAAARCRALAGTHLAGAVIERAEPVPAGPLAGGPGPAAMLPGHCLVRGTIDRRTGVSGRAYGIGFELRMPVAWNGRFLFQGGAGLDGQVAPAIGRIANSARLPALARGFAVASTDAGHSGSPIDATFAVDQQARIDYGYNALDKVTIAAKALIQRHYGKVPLYSYMVGCSNGGRQAMTAAQRLPLYFDGVVAGDPSIRFSRVAIDEIWNLHVLARIAPRDAQGRPIYARAFSNADLDLVRAAVLRRCDARDGLKDGMINDWRGCDFNPASLKCPRAKTAACLSAGQVAALRDLHRGPRTADGQSLYGPFNYDTGIASPTWRGMRLGKSQDGKADAADATLGLGQLRYLQLTPPDPDFDPLDRPDYARIADRVRDTAALADADNPFLSSFVGHGRLIVYNGLSDQGLASSVVADWYDRMLAVSGPGARDAVRLFLVPGMLHCGGGEATDQFEMLDAIMDWVEQGKAPARIVAAPAGRPGPQRPLCPYPAIARYKGGDEASADSFVCEG